MLKKTHTYYDFDGQQRTEDFYFNLTEAELTDMRYSLNGGLEQLLEKIIQENDEKQIMEYFKKILLFSYGKKSLDGRQFIKNDAIREEFASTNAFSDIYMELSHDAGKAVEFVNGIMPKARNKTESPAVNVVPLPGQAPITGVTPPTT